MTNERLTSENTRALVAEADQILVDLASALPLEDVKAHLPAPSFLHARIGEAREKLADALSVPDTDNREARERLVEYLRTQNVFQGDMNVKIAEEQAREILAVLAAFPVLSTDVDALRAELERVRGSADAWWNQYDKAEAARQEAEAALSRAAAPEPEWEYAIFREGFEPKGPTMGIRSMAEAIAYCDRVKREIGAFRWAMRRRKAGPWEALPVGGESEHG